MTTETSWGPRENQQTEAQIRRKHLKAIKANYVKHGVGRTIKHKLAYWEATDKYKDGYTITHNPSDKQKVAVFEMCWLVDTFPQDMHFA